ncbi:hypothetical protein [Pedobacter panaciterrae]
MTIKNFEWKSGFNLTIQRNKLASFPGLEQSSYANDYFIGKSLSVQNIFHSLGVNPETGVYQFAGKNGNPTSAPDPFTDQTVLVDTRPVLYGGLMNNFSYKGFSLDFLFQFVKQRTFGNKFGMTPGDFFSNQPISVLSRWQNPGDYVDVQRFNSDYSLAQTVQNASRSDANWVDASYIKLKNLSLSWQLPMQIKNILHLGNCKLYIQGENLFTLTRFDGLDAETKSIYSLPPLRVITFGAKIGL